MKRARRIAAVIVMGVLPSLAVCAPACVTNLSYTPTEMDAGPELPDLALPKETPDACGLVVTPGAIDFGGLFVGVPLVRTISVKNFSESSFDVSLSSTDPVRFALPVGVTTFPLAPSETRTVDVTATLDSENRFSATVNLSVAKEAGAPCVSRVNLVARTTDRGRQIGPQPIDLGSAACKGPGPTPKKLSITSVNADPGTFTASVSAPFAVAPPSGGVGVSGTVFLDVSSASLNERAGQVSGNLALEIKDKSGTDKKDIEVKAIALGANLVFDKNALVFNELETQIVTLENTGNQAVTVELASQPIAYKFQGRTGSSISLEAPPSRGAKEQVSIQSVTNQQGTAQVVIAGVSKSVVCAFGGLTLYHTVPK